MIWRLVAELHHLAAERLVLAALAHNLERLFHCELELLRADRLGDAIDTAGLMQAAAFSTPAKPAREASRRSLRARRVQTVEFRRSWHA